MANTPLVVGVDQGTSSTKAVLVDASGTVVRRATVPVDVSYPRPGWVEQDAEQLEESTFAAITGVIGDLDHVLDGVGDGVVVGLGVSAQRESAIVWERASGKALGPVLGWQDRRTQEAAARLTVEGAAGDVRSITGLPLDPMFSALKFGWLLDTVDPDRRRSRSGEIAVGTVDSWILAALTGRHRIEAGNASRTQLLDLASAGWSERLCDLFGVPSATLPEVVASDAPVTITAGPLAGVPVAAVLADSHAATYAHGIRTPGRIKATYGTGSSIMALSEGLSGSAATGLTETIAWQVGTTSYALEGNILATGATVRWMAELLDCTPNDLHELAAAVTVPSDVTVVPAFSGLGAPWWDPHARGLIANLDLATGRGDLARAAFESIAHQIEDVVGTVVSATATDVETIAADGGPSGNDWLMQLQADTSQRAVVRSAAPDLSALGVADLAAVTVGVRPPSASAVGSGGTRFEPDPTVDAARRRNVWSDALARARRSAQTPSPTERGPT